MVTESHTYHYSMTTNEQDNPNLTVTRNHWSDMAKAVNGGTDYATSKYTRKGTKNYTYTVPHTLTAHDFRLEIPTNAYITRVRFEVAMKVDSKKIKVKAPNAHFMIYKGSGSVTQAKTGKTGWYDSTYRVYATTYLSTSWKTLTYTLSGDEWNKMKYPSTQLNNNIMGIDLHFNTPESMSVTSAGVQLRWVRIIVDYEMPNYSISYVNGANNSGSNPLMVNVGEEYCVKAQFKNNTRSDGGTQSIDVQLPFGSVLKSFSSKNSSTLTEVDAFNGKYLLQCDGKGLASDTLTFCLQSNAYGLKTLDLTHNNVVYPYYVYPLTDNEDFGDLQIVPSTIEQNKTSCFKFSAKVRSTDTSIVFGVTVDGDELTDWSKVSQEVLDYYGNSNHGNNLISWELEQSSQVEGVNINWTNTNNNQIAFNVPANTDVNLAWTGCFVPLFDGANHIRVVNGDTSQTTSVAYNCISAEDIVIDCKIDDTVWLDHRVVTQVTTDGYIIRCAVRDSDKVMVEGDCTLKSYIWEEVAYIGCIPLPRSHYEPSHDFTNKILSESYKNKTYKGKEGVYEDDTDFKIRLPPKEWTTLQGLSKLDKPIPVNAVPTAFEGDVLNFRGWYEIGGIKGVTQTNPLYYDGQVDLDPLTHNINTRFSIEKGNASNPYTITSALATVVETGDEFANRTYINEDGEIVSTSEGYFDIETDGVYIYDSELEDNLRTIITLDNAQYIKMVSKDVLNEHTEIKLEWNSSKISENKENLIERIIYITDDTGKALFKYQYSDFEFDFDNDYYTCQVTGTVINDGEEKVVIQKELIMAVDVESLDLIADEDGNIVQESEPAVDEVTDGSDEEEGVYSFNDYVYGTTLTFSLNGNVLKVIDAGWNGRGIVSDNIELSIANYKYELDFKNNNTDVETTEVLTFFDFEVSEAVQSSDLTNFYGNMFVTSFPVVGKKILFTRQSQEGTIYYLADDGSNNFTYVQEPFYMYFCGVDLANHKGSSLFDLDNSYTTFYLQNGLVRLGFNRISGELYLSKYDTLAGEYINVSYLKATNLDFTVSSYSDDKITIKAGTTTYTMYRGHPYVIINHPDEDFEIFNTINRVYTDRVNDDAYDYPAFFDLTNKDNLLPSCVGSSNVSISCLDVSNEFIEETVTIPTITLSQLTSPIYTNELAYFGVTGSISSVSDNVPFEEPYYNGEFGLYSSDLLVDNSAVYRSGLYADNSIIQNGDLTTLRYRAIDFDGVGCNGLSVDFIQKNKQLYYDTGTNYSLIRATTSVSSGNRTVTATADAGHFFLNSSNQIYSNPIIVEFDVSARTIASGGGINLDVYDGTNEYKIWINSTGHYKILIDENGATALDGSQSITKRGTKPNINKGWRLSFQVYKNTDTFTFSNLTVIGDVKVYHYGDIITSDDATTSSHNDIWTVGDGTLTRDTNYSELTIATGKTFAYMNFNINQTPFVIEFDVKSGHTGWLQTFRNISGTIIGGFSLSELDLSTDEWHHINIVYDGTDIFISNTENTSRKRYFNVNAFNTFQIDARTSSYAQIKNFKIYQSVEFSTTNSNGIATCNLIGDGSGLETYYAKANNLESDPIQLLDCIYYDEATSTNPNNNIWTSNNATLTRATNGSVFTATANWGSVKLPNLSLTGKVIVEYDVVEADGVAYGGLMSSTKVNGNYRYIDFPKTMGHHRHEITQTTQKLTVDGAVIQNITNNDITNEIIIRFTTSTSGSSLTYRNFVVYPIESEEEPTPVEPVVTSLTLSNTKDILSAHDSESTTLTATVKDQNGDAMSGESVVFKKGSTTLDTVQTNSNGVATYTYTADGSGDITITVECESLTETQSIEDCLITLLSETTVTNSSGTKISSIGLDTIPNIQNTDFILSFEHKGNGTLSIGSKNYWSSSSANYRLTLGYADNKHYYSVRTSSTNEGYGASASISTNYEYRIEREGSSIRFYQGETLITTQTATFLTSYNTWSIYSLIWGSATSVFKNIKLKPL